MNIITTVLYVLLFSIQAVIALYLLIPPFFTFVYFLRRLFRLKGRGEKQAVLTNKQFEFGIIITAHEEVEFIHPLVDSILKQTYGNFAVYIVADACDTSTLVFSDPRITVLRPETALNAKIKSIEHGIRQFKKEHDAVIILDADNLIHPLFLSVMNSYFQKGYKAVQSEFKAKNTDSPFARMDAIGDIFNFFVEREMRMEVGLSAAIWGSGIAVDLQLYKEVIYTNFLGGFDKKLQSHLIQRVPMIAFAKEAILYDEKISTGSSLETQRTRWINAQFRYFKLGVSLMLRGIFKGNFDQAYFAFITIRPPMFMLLFLAFVFSVTNFFIDYRLGLTWTGLFLLFILSFVTIVLIKDKERRLAGTLLMMPLFMMRQVFAFIKIGRANKTFLKTKHSKVIFIDQIIGQQAAAE